eukprot:CAMPEP_0114224662 /NCGR_PEP_ID=MMETSP0058-20121206/233_1 /TAXON_ID=36894 /ORGANISM="Pyramimonas parkeae, CCMP726" /LENGTH=340 /DNA_ID=CAMNT_0001335165 /DNA_START=428 /DNA_END=1450 /DNA_ORIENTATION=-
MTYQTLQLTWFPWIGFALLSVCVIADEGTRNNAWLASHNLGLQSVLLPSEAANVVWSEITGNGLGTQERDQEGRHLLGRWQIGKKQPKVEDPSLGDETDSPSGSSDDSELDHKDSESDSDQATADLGSDAEETPHETHSNRGNPYKPHTRHPTPDPGSVAPTSAPTGSPTVGSTSPTSPTASSSPTTAPTPATRSPTPKHHFPPHCPPPLGCAPPNPPLHLPPRAPRPPLNLGPPFLTGGNVANVPDIDNGTQTYDGPGLPDTYVIPRVGGGQFTIGSSIPQKIVGLGFVGGCLTVLSAGLYIARSRRGVPWRGAGEEMQECERSRLLDGKQHCQMYGAL